MEVSGAGGLVLLALERNPLDLRFSRFADKGTHGLM